MIKVLINAVTFFEFFEALSCRETNILNVLLCLIMVLSIHLDETTEVSLLVGIND